MTDSPDALLAEARRLLETRSGTLAGAWPRAVALLTRQALEQMLDDLWRWQAPGAQLASRHAQLLCLGAVLGDEEAARDARYTWAVLSRACHHHVYELPPTGEELEGLIDRVSAFIQKIQSMA